MTFDATREMALKKDLEDRLCKLNQMLDVSRTANRLLSAEVVALEKNNLSGQKPLKSSVLG